MRVVSSSLVCLPDFDSGGGQGWSRGRLRWMRRASGLTVDAGVFEVRTCKLCRDDGIVIGGEYGISKAILDKNYNLATLQSMVQSDVDWADPAHWAAATATLTRAGMGPMMAYQCIPLRQCL